MQGRFKLGFVDGLILGILGVTVTSLISMLTFKALIVFVQTQIILTLGVALVVCARVVGSTVQTLLADMLKQKKP